MIQCLRHNTRRVSASTGGQTDGSTGRKKPGPPTRARGSRVVGWKKLAGSRPYPPSNLQQAQKKFGQAVQSLREQMRLSQQRLGADCGIKTAKLKKIETGKVDVDLLAIIRLAQRLGATLENLLRGIE